VEGQPLAANVERLIEALAYLGAPLSAETTTALHAAGEVRDARQLQQLLDPHVLVVVSVSRGAHANLARGPAQAILQQGGFTPILVKVVNDGAVAEPLRFGSPQAGPVYGGVATLSMTRQGQLPLKENENLRGNKGRFLAVEMFTSQPMTARLSGLKVEYALALIYSSETGRRTGTLQFEVGASIRNRNFGELPITFEVRPAIPLRLSIRDDDGQPTCARLTIRDKSGHVYPPQAKRLAPDLFFQQQIYRADGGIVLLPPGEFMMQYSRGPEYRLLERKVTIPAHGDAHLDVQLQRWVDPAAYGFYSGDHHIHAAGCAHYTIPTEGVLGRDLFSQIKGEGLNVGCILTWGPCFQFQQQFFEPTPNKLSGPFSILKYDIEVSGFGSQALGHVCLLNLRDQNYPGSDGIRNWPTWTTPVLRWAKQQGAFTGYAHSASGLQINPPAAAHRLLTALDADHDGKLGPAEAAHGLLPEPFAVIDANDNGFLSEAELTASHDRVADRLPNLAIPELDSVGAQEIFVTVAQGLCDFISAMDTARVAEWNCWYHLLNCGFPLKVSGETDFPCMSGTRVGQGRVYVQLGKVDHIDFRAWCEGLAHGRSYVSDGYAHALEFTVANQPAGGSVSLEQPGTVPVKARVAFAADTPVGTPYGTAAPVGGNRLVGDTVDLHGSSPLEGTRRSRMCRVELVVNGHVAGYQDVPADGQPHDLTFTVPIDRSSWVALRHFPELHTNPVNVLVAGRPIRASRQSALWCIGCIEQLWRVRGQTITPAERGKAHRTFQEAIKVYRQIAAEAPAGS
jgi:hypothetical protein